MPQDEPKSNNGLNGDEAPAQTADQNAEIVHLREELEEMKDRALRALADLDNYRKRAERTVADERRYAGLPLLRDLLPVLDNVRRAIEAGQKSTDPKPLLDGVELVSRLLRDVLAKHHCTPIVALHQPFNPNLHEAVLQQPSPEQPAGAVLMEVREGFMLHDRVVRPSQVIVSSGPENKPAE